MANSAVLSGTLMLSWVRTKLPRLAIQGEALDAIAEGQHQHGLRAVDGVAGGDLGGARLEEGFLAQGIVLVQVLVGAAQHREDGADRDVDVDVAGAVQRVEDQQVGAFRIAPRNLVGVVHLLGGHAGQVAGPFVGFQQDLVGHHVQLLLHLALHVLGAHAAEHAAQRALGHRMADFLAGTRHDLDEEAQVGRGVVAAGLLDQIAAQGNAGHGWLRREEKTRAV